MLGEKGVREMESEDAQLRGVSRNLKRGRGGYGEPREED